jgi:hypothetical protein
MIFLVMESLTGGEFLEVINKDPATKEHIIATVIV